MADRIQQRRDTAARWAQYNPILLEGEVGYVTDDPNQYKIGDGVHAWNELPLRGFDGTLVHELGTSQTAAMSQQGVTDVANLSFLFDQIISRFGLNDVMTNNDNVNSYIPLSSKSLVSSSVPPRTPYYYMDFIQTYIRKYAFRYVYVYIRQVGSFSIYKATGVGSSDSYNEELILTTQVEKTGWNVIDLGSNITLADNEYIGFSSPNDTAKFGFVYSSSVNIESFIYGGISETSWIHGNGYLNIGLGISNEKNIKIPNALNGFPYGYINNSQQNMILDINFINQTIKFVSVQRDNSESLANCHIVGRNLNSRSLFWHTVSQGENDDYPFIYGADNISSLEDYELVIAFICSAGRICLCYYGSWSDMLAEYQNNVLYLGNMRMHDLSNGCSFGVLPQISSKIISTVDSPYAGLIPLNYNINMVKQYLTVRVNGVNISDLITESHPYNDSLLLAKPNIKVDGMCTGNATLVYSNNLYTPIFTKDITGKYIKSIIFKVNNVNGFVSIFAAKPYEFNDEGNPKSYRQIKLIKRIKINSGNIQEAYIDYQSEEGEYLCIYSQAQALNYFNQNDDIHVEEKQGFIVFDSNGTAYNNSSLNVKFTYYDSKEDETSSNLSDDFIYDKIYGFNGSNSKWLNQFIEEKPSLGDSVYQYSGSINDVNEVFFQLRRDKRNVGAYIKSVRIYTKLLDGSDNIIRFYSAKLLNDQKAFIDPLCVMEYAYDTDGWQDIEIHHQLGPDRVLGINVSGSFIYSTNADTQEDTYYVSGHKNLLAGVSKLFSGHCFHQTFQPTHHNSGMFEGYYTMPVRMMTSISSNNTNSYFLGYFISQRAKYNMINKRTRGVEFYSCTDKTQFTICIYESENVQLVPPTLYTDLTLVKRITLTGVKRGFNKIDFDEPIILLENQFISISNPENHDFTNETSIGYMNEYSVSLQDDAESDAITNEIFDTFYYHSSDSIVIANGNLVGFYSDYDDRQIYCPTEAEFKGGLGKMANKSISFIGDSITTFSGFIPSANAIYYPNSSSGITSVRQTYWMKCIGKMKMRLFTNEAWSGSRLTGTSASAAVSESRWNNLRSTGTTGDDPDYIVIHISTNDWTGSVAMGEYDFTDDANKNQLKSAWCYLIRKLQVTYPKAKIFVCTLLFRQQWTDHEYLHTNSAGNTIQDYNKVIREIADMFGIRLIELDKCGFNAVNFTNGSYPDSNNIYSNNDGLHPNAAGARLIADYMDEYLFDR